jgi:diguanylate cyclase (GGDEF)-like protein/PAS domain S-box-containing protein
LTSDPPRQQRLDLLKLKAQRLAESEPALPADTGPARAQQDLLEDLRVHQLELEVQNEELRRAQQEAESSRARYRSIFDQLPLPALVLDARGRVEQGNARVAALLGPTPPYTPMDNRLVEHLGREDRARLHVALRDFVPGQNVVLERLSLAVPGKPPAVVDAHLIQLAPDMHPDTRLLLLLVDRSAEVLRDRERSFFSAMLDSSDSLIYAADTDGLMLLANRAWLQFLGHSATQVIGHRREDFMPLRDAALHNRSDQAVLLSGEPVTLEEVVHIGGLHGKVELLTRKFALRDTEGQIYGIGAVATDITELKARHSQARLSESVFLMASEAIIVTDPDARIERVNPAFTAQSGFSAQAVTGHLASVIKSPVQDSQVYEEMWKALLRVGRWAGELMNRAADGRDYAVWNSISAIRNDQGKVLHYMAIQTDLSALQAAQTEVQRLALYDSLTGLPNRALFGDRIRQQIEHAQRHGESFAIIFADLDHFKEVNDTLGHAVGDRLLQQVAQRLCDSLRSEDTVARMGGDEFVVLLPGADAPTGQMVAEKLLATLCTSLDLGMATPYRPMASAGVAVFPQDGTDIDMLLRNADIAMYRSKQEGRNRVTRFHAQMSLDNANAFAIQTALAVGIDHQELRLHYQPQIDLRSGRMVGVEALVRWQREGLPLALPAEFLPTAERCGLTRAMDHWVLNEALRQLSLWQQSGLWQPHWRMALNRTTRDLRNPGLVSDLQAMLQAHGVATSALELEITEGALLEHSHEVIQRLNELRQLGVTLAIDDFGTNYSNLAYLRRLPVQVIKIDRSFVSGMLSSDSDRVLVETIVAMAHKLGHTLVAEGVETQGQCDALLALGCETGQGFLFGHAVPAEELMARWATGQALPGSGGALV